MFRVYSGGDGFEGGGHGDADVGGGIADVDAAGAEDFHFGGCGVFVSAYDGACMAHAAAGGGGLAGDEADYGFAVAVGLYPAGGFGFEASADFAYHDDAF